MAAFEKQIAAIKMTPDSQTQQTDNDEFTTVKRRRKGKKTDQKAAKPLEERLVRKFITIHQFREL